MLKKNIAKAMAAATVISTAVPMTQVLAAPRAVVDSTQNEEVKAVKEKVAELIVMKYTTDKNLLAVDANAGKKVFNISINGVGGPYSSFADFEAAFDKAYNNLEEGQTLKVDYSYAQGVAHRVLEDGTVVDFGENPYTKTILDGFKDASVKGFDIDTVLVGEGIKTTTVDGTVKYQVRISDENGSRRFVEVKAGDDILSLTTPKLRVVNGYYVDINGDAIVKVDKDDVPVLKPGSVSNINGTVAVGTVSGNANFVVDGFYPETGNTGLNSADDKYLISDVVTKNGFVEVEMNSSEMFNVSEGRLTQKGNEILSKINGLYYNPHKNYEVKSAESLEKDALIVYANEIKADGSRVKIVELTISKDEADKKGAAYDKLKQIIDARNFKDIIRTAAGDDRYTTAVEVSRLAWGKPLTGNNDGEKAVVLVSGDKNALVDGLTATPLANSLNDTNEGAPILLTKKNTVPQEVLDEMKFLGANTVYIVGGENSVSDEVVKTLESRYGMTVKRLAGDGRYETSLAVAEAIAGDEKVDEVFVVGGNSEADALSAAAIAGNLNAPIILNPQDKLTKATELFLTTKVDGDTSAARRGDEAIDIYVVGGKNSISEAVLNKMTDLKDTEVTPNKLEVKRLAGDGRQDTNAAVIKEFYTNKAGSTAAPGDDAFGNKIVVAKSDNNGLVDALGAGAAAAKFDAALVLATESLSESQSEELAKVNMLVLGDDRFETNKVQVGNGIASLVAKAISKLK